MLAVLVQRDLTMQGPTQAASHCFSWYVLQAIAGIQAHLMTMVHLHRL